MNNAASTSGEVTAVVKDGKLELQDEAGQTVETNAPVVNADGVPMKAADGSQIFASDVPIEPNLPTLSPAVMAERQYRRALLLTYLFNPEQIEASIAWHQQQAAAYERLMKDDAVNPVVKRLITLEYRSLIIRPSQVDLQFTSTSGNGWVYQVSTRIPTQYNVTLLNNGRSRKIMFAVAYTTDGHHANYSPNSKLDKKTGERVICSELDILIKALPPEPLELLSTFANAKGGQSDATTKAD